MRTVDLEDAATDLTRLVQEAVDWAQPFVVTRAGKALVTVSPVPPASKRFGFMPGIKVPEDFDTMMEDEIAEMFGAKD